ncbi:MAG: GNAT family N-acetyltransferase [Gemmatimonadetes bacterium]|nr:GNAT family N-acetyltransferase [Gemmatimonadota bacterium]
MTPDPKDPSALPDTLRLALRVLGPEDAPGLQRVFAASGDYFLPLTGRPEPDPDAAERELRGGAGTPGRDVALVTLRESGEPVGALGWWRGNPGPDQALLGMLLVVPEQRGRGIAREALDALEGWLAGGGIRSLRTSVGLRDYRSQEVLAALGFARMSIRDHQALGLQGATLSLWEKQLG